MMIKVNKSALIALKLLNEKGYDAFIVGGAVRDILLKQDVYDYDITTNADPNAIKLVFSDYAKYDVGRKHGTINVLIDKDRIDITPYRKEEKYLDHRHPDYVSFDASLKDDLSRRDFTINAMCIDSNLNVIDYFNGIDDLNNKVIRCIGNPKKRFDEDALRILRAIRFKAKLSFSIEEETAKQIHKCKDLLNYISPERKKDELLKILAYKDGFKVINEYIDVFKTFMPFEISKRKINNFSQPLYALSYLLIDKKVNLKALKYSRYEIELINIFINAAKININNDEEFIECLSSIYQKQILNFLNEYHRKDFTDRYNKNKKYMVTINELKIDGDEISSFGYKGKQLGIVKQRLLKLIHQKKIINTNRSLKAYLAKHQVV